MEFFSPVEEMTAEERRIYLQEGLILDVTEQVWATLESKGINRKELAEALHTSRANISQLLSGSRNMTLRTLSDMADALGCTVHIKLDDRDEDRSWRPVRDGAPIVANTNAMQTICAANEWTPLSTVNG
jgi:transcriptional regulator with XRE-family HTH domain